MADNTALLQALSPSYDPAQYAKLQHNKLMADMLMQQSQQPLQGGMAGNVYVGVSPLQALAKVLTTYAGNKMGTESDEALRTADAANMRAAYASLLGGGGLGGGGGGQPAPQALPDGVKGTYPAPDGSSIGDTGSQSVPVPQPSQQVQPQGGGMFGSIPSRVAGSMPLINALLGDNTGKAVLDQYKPADIIGELRAAGIDPNSAIAQQLAQARLAKGSYVAPVSGRAGSYLRDPFSNRVVAYNQAIPEGASPVFDAAGNVTGTTPLPGAAGVMQQNATAGALGKTMGTLNTGVDAQNNPAYVLGVPPGTVGAQQPPLQAPQQAPVGQPQPMPQAAPQQRAAPQQNDRAAILAQELQSNLSDLQRAQQSGDMEAVYVAQRNLTELAKVMPQAGQQPSGQQSIRPAAAAGFSEYTNKTAGAAGDRVNTMMASAADSPVRVNVLDNILSLSKAGIATGPTADWVNKAKGVAADAMGIKTWKDDVSGFQEINKFLLQNGQRAWSSAGGSQTDAQLQSYLHSNPNTSMTPAALQAMSRWAKAGEIALQAKATAFQNANISTPQQQAQFENTWRQNLDPRLYQIKLMDPQEATAFVAKIKQSSPPDYAAMIQKAQALKQMGGL